MTGGGLTADGTISAGSWCLPPEAEASLLLEWIKPYEQAVYKQQGAPGAHPGNGQNERFNAADGMREWGGQGGSADGPSAAPAGRPRASAARGTGPPACRAPDPEDGAFDPGGARPF